MISEVARRALFGELLRAGQMWFGGLDEIEFLARLFDLKALPSTDARFSDASGDIWQHRVNNPEDWPDDWLLSDARFGLLEGSDEAFLRFLQEVIHPAVREDAEVRRIWKTYNELLSSEGWEFFPVEQVGGRVRYEPRRKRAGPAPTRLLLDYRAGGSVVLHLGERVDDSVAGQALARARSALTADGNRDALRLLGMTSFALQKGTNTFGDYYYAAHAEVPTSVFDEYRTAASSRDAPIKKAAAALRATLNRELGGQPEVRFVALTLSQYTVQGVLGEYSYDEDYFDSGGFAVIHHARSKERNDLALKRLHAPDAEAAARLRREIQEQIRIQHPAVMPIVDHDPAFEWFVMPLADENLVDLWNAGPISDEALLEILAALASGLGAAHALGLVHRDVSHRNVLRIGKQWVVADWGVVRRPPGLTTMVRTQGELGTNGFAAPELFRTAHHAGPAADVYSLGRIAAWAVTRKWPEQNVPLLPAGPWRHLVKRTTEHEASRRPQSMAEFGALLAEVAKEVRAESKAEPAERRPTDGHAFFEACLAAPDDADLHLDHLHRAEDSVLASWIEDRPHDVAVLAHQLETHLLDGAAWGGRGFDAVGSRIAWLRRVAQHAATRGEDGLLEDAVGSLFRVEAHCERFPQRQATRTWLESVSGASARTVARVLSREVDALRWFLAEGWFPQRADPVIVAVCEAAALGRE